MSEARTLTLSQTQACNVIASRLSSAVTPTNHDQGKVPPSARWFATTHWSVVLAAKNGDSPTAANALEKLCRTYWQPLYAYIRREGHDATEAQDLTQEFFARLLERNYLGRLQHQRGKFRSFPSNVPQTLSFGATTQGPSPEARRRTTIHFAGSAVRGSGLLARTRGRPVASNQFPRAGS